MAKTVKIQMRDVGEYGPTLSRDPGQEYEVSAAEAERLIERKLADQVDPPASRAKETATRGPAETRGKAAKDDAAEDEDAKNLTVAELTAELEKLDALPEEGGGADGSPLKADLVKALKRARKG